MSVTPTTATRRKRRRVLALLTAAFGVIPSATGFGLSSVGPQGGLTAVAVSDGALVTRGSAAALDTIRWRGERQGQQQQQQQQQRKVRGGRRRVHEITCKVASPRRYGSSDWWTNIQNLPKSRLLYNIKEHLFYNTAFAFAVSMVHALTPQHIIDDLHVSAIPHSIMSGALGLLLVFRTNAAYNRFWEARQVWGNLINQCRNIARLSAVALGPDSAEWKEMKEYIRMFPFLLKQHLQDTRADEELDWVSLPDGQVARVQDDPNPPLFACQIMSEILARAYSEGGTGQSEGGRVPDYTSVMYRMEIEQGLSSLIDGLGKCERILTTPVPRGYSRHTSRFLTVYGFTLPVVLVPHTELFTAPVVAAVCWGLFSIEEIAYFIEQPFDPEYRQLDLMAYSEKVARDIERMTASSTLGRLGSSSSPHLPGSGAAGEGLLLSTYRQQLEDLGLPVVQSDPTTDIDSKGHVKFNSNGFGASHRVPRGVNGANGRGGDDNVFDPEDEAERVAAGRSKVDKISQSWKGSADDDIVGG